MCKWCSQNVHILDSVCTLFCPSPRSPLKHVTRLGPTRYWISATGLMVVHGEDEGDDTHWRQKCNRPTDLSHIQIFQNVLGQNWKQNWLSGMAIFRTNETHYLPLIGGIAPTTVYVHTITCYTVMPHSANVILFRNSRNFPTLDIVVCKLWVAKQRVTSLWQH